MRRLFASLVDVRPGEGRLVVRSTAILFGLIAAHTLLETARDALFLAKLPPSRLTFVYGALAALAILAGRLNARFVRAFGRRNALVFTLFGAAYGTVLLYLLPPTSEAFFALYVWSGLLGSVLVVQFWLYASRSFTVAQSKRLFGLVAAGGVLGAVTGASAAVPLVEALPVDELLLVAAAAFLATAVGVTASPSDQPGVPVGTARDGPPLSGALGVLRGQPYLTRLALLIGLSTATVLATDYLFKSVTAAAIPPDELGGFFARYYAGLNAAALVVQLLVTNALVRRLGVVAAFCVLPGLLLVGAAGALVTGGALLAVLAVKGADGGLRHSLHRISAELLWMPVADDLRSRTKVFIDTVVVRGTQAGTAALLLGASMLGLASPRNLAIAVLALAALWLLSGFGLRSAYLDLFREALRTRPEGDAGLQLDLDGVEIVVASLSSRDPVRAVAAIHLLVSSGRSRLIPALVLYHESEAVLLEALDAIASPDREDWVPLARRLLEHDAQPVRFAALRALARVGDREAIQGRLLDISPAVRAHAAFWLAEHDDTEPASQPEVQDILQMRGPAGAEAQAGLLHAIAAEGRSRWAQVVLQAVESEDPRVVEAAAHAMARVRDERFIPYLVDHLRHRAGREAVREAIVALGPPALDALEAALASPTTPRRVRRHVPRTISRFGTQRAADILCRHLADEQSGRLRYKILRGLGRMVDEHPVRIDRRTAEAQARDNLVEHIRLGALGAALDADPPASAGLTATHELLVGLVRDKAQQALERAFRLLQLVHRKDDLRSAYLAAGSADKARRAQALEFLDALTLDATVPDLRALLRLAVDDLPWTDRVDRAAAMPPTTTLDLDVRRPRATLLTQLAEDPDDDVRRIAAHYAARAAQLEVPDEEAAAHAG